MIEGVISLSPSHETPLNGCAKVAAPIATGYSPSSRSSKRKVPSASVVVEATFAAGLILQLDRDAGQPELLLLDLARLAAARLEVSPDDAVDPALERLRFDRLLGAVRHFVRRNLRQTERRDVAGADRLGELVARLRRAGQLVGRRRRRGKHAGR